MFEEVNFIKVRLPSDQPYSDEEIIAELTRANNNKYLALASLWEQLGSNDKYKSVSAGNVSYSEPLYFERANYWRGQATATEPITGTQISFVPATGLFGIPATAGDEYSMG